MNFVHVILRQLIGMEIIMLSSNTILSKITSGGSLTPRMGTIIIGVINLLGNVAGIFTVGGFNRKTLFTWGYFGIFLCHVCLGILTIME